MKTFRIALLAATVALIAPGVALAQERGPDGRGYRDRGGDQGSRQDGSQQAAAPQPAPPQQQARPDMRGGGDRQDYAQGQGRRDDGQGYGRDNRQGDGGRFDRGPGGGDRGDGDRGRDGGQPGGFDGRRDGQRPPFPTGPGVPHGGQGGTRFGGNPGYGGGPGYNGGRPGPDRSWRPGYNWRADRSYDWRGWRDGHRDAFRVGRYYAPRGWGYGYRRFSIGYRLPGFFYAQNYWLADPWAYRLPPAYGPYRWIRYYDDVLLVDLRSGEIVDAIPDFFF